MPTTDNTHLPTLGQARRDFLKRAGMAALVPATLAGCGVSGEAPNTYTKTIAISRAAILKAMADSGTPSVSVALIDRDHVIWSEAFGLIDKANHTAPTTETLFGVGSIAKLFATIATMILVERGLVDLDAPLVRYLPSFVMASPEYTQITVRMLLSHASGFPGTDYRSLFSFAYRAGYAQQVMQTLATSRLKHAPGEMSVYCNDGFTMIELLVQAITGKTYTQFVTQEVLAPLGMSRSSYTLQPFAPGSFAPAYQGDKKIPQEYTLAYATGGLYSNPSEMGQIARMLLNGGAVDGVRILRAESVLEMARDQTPSQPRRPVIMPDGWGLGWDGIRQGGLDAVGIKAWHKNGGTSVYGSELFVLPDEGLALMISGTSTAYGSGALAERVLLNALAERRTIPAIPPPLPETPDPVATPTQTQLDAMTGIFANYAGLFQIKAGIDQTMSLRTWTKDGWSDTTSGLKWRTDGTLSSDGLPNRSYRAVTSMGQSYIAMRVSMGVGHWRFEATYAQKITPKEPLSAAWQSRMGRQWLAVNDPAASIGFAEGGPAFTLVAVPELPGYILATSAYKTHGISDASASDSVAHMCLRIPFNNSRDLDDVVIELKYGEEWVRAGGCVYRPAQSVRALVAGTNAVPIGDEGYAEWRTVPAQCVLSTTGATAWKLFDANLKLVPEGRNDATAHSATAGSRLLLYAAARSSITVTSV